MVYRFVAQHVRLNCRALSARERVMTNITARARSGEASSRVNTLERSLSILLVNRQTYSEAQYCIFEDVVCSIVGRPEYWYHPGALFEQLFETSQHVQNKLARMRHVVISFQDLDSMLGTPSVDYSFEKRVSLLRRVKSVKIVVKQAHDIARVCQPWGIDYESKKLKIGTKQDAVAVLNKNHVVGLFNGPALAKLIEQGCFNQKVKVLFEAHISPRKALLMRVNKDWKVDMEVVWKKNAVGSSVWF